ncbi:adenylate/guanylate cyclase domain-containing protein [Mycobacterium intermedium]|uniref:Adenylate/guanylate cyclase domain-containing protein n=1 Tax=Mycobacterium intermedium TaxID=28445 RepID=A0A1E3SMG1_MYCIE|nr:adenylate/guanylate cyclase domain-containing protein [Mycobacterium intermedium]MCV6963445.1 HAMP domain-containing protein [Mycobacterium intermedium]ODR02833.1 cyclase [Mycobacterium intermedium]OPE46891.1 adenylate/guanylate cyclase domain-containing protein [Mycobacterium intermedium]ORA98688.1 adenylate/guanylate cyclase domain-containing protein [Mycobacterium intermedium]
MDRFVKWAWDRFGAQYSWVIYGVSVLVPFPIYLFLSCAIVTFEKSGHYLQAATAAAVAMLMLAYGIVLPGRGAWRLVERWAAGEAVDPAKALEATYTWSRRAVLRGLAAVTVCGALLSFVVGVIAGAGGPRLIQYAVLGGVVGAGTHLIGVHSVPEGPMRPVRAAIAGNSGIGDSLPRSRPTFAAWSNLCILSVAFGFSLAGATVAGEFDQSEQSPLLWLAIGCVLTLGFAVPITVISVFGPSLQPIRDLAEGTKRVAAGDYSRRLPVVQDDDLGALAASFNRMQAGLAERQRLHAAFGTYVDPSLAARLLEQGDDVFTGERREVSVMFVDIRDFTPFAEAHTAEEAVAHLNTLFEIVVPAVVGAGGHVNKFLGDGALAVFGAPNELAKHADAALRAAVSISRHVAERLGGRLRIGVGINTGVVIAGTIGGGGKLEFTLIGDTVNVAARVEQLTKITGDVILMTQQTVAALGSRPPGLADRGAHALKGKSAPITLFGLDPAVNPHLLG